MMTQCLAVPFLVCQEGYIAPPYALCTYLTTHYDELLRQLTRRLGCRDRASDALHETWLRLRDARPASSVDSPKAYVARMAYHVAVDRIRSDTQYSAVHWESDADLYEAIDPMPGPEELLVMRSLLRRLIDAIESLPRQRRAIFVAARLEDLSQKEVARRYGVSEVKVRNELRKAHAHCEQVLRNA